jgi:hypothetical protein
MAAESKFASDTAKGRAQGILKRVGAVPAAAAAPAATSASVEAAPTATPTPKLESGEYEINPIGSKKITAATTPAQEKAPVEPAQEEQLKTIPKEYLPEDPTDEVGQLMDPKSTVGDNFHRLRTKLKSVLKERKADVERLQELENLKKRVSEYESGAAVPDILQAQLARIAELEVYEKRYNFTGTPAYQKEFAEPLKAKKEALVALAKDYNLSEDVLNAAFKAKSQAEEDALLSKHFGNPLGASQAKNLLQEIRSIQIRAAEAEKEPVQSLARMQQENDRILAEERARANELIKHTSKEGWNEALVTLREDGRFKEVTFIDGDNEHNEKYVRPILNKAMLDYGKTARMLAENGLKQLPKDLAVKLARADQLANYAGVLVAERDRLAQELSELKALMTKKTYLNRPSVSGTGSNGASVAVTPSTAVGPKNAGRKVLARVGA